MSAQGHGPPPADPPFGGTAARVITIEAVTLVALWLLQAYFTP